MSHRRKEFELQHRSSPTSESRRISRGEHYDEEGENQIENHKKSGRAVKQEEKDEEDEIEIGEASIMINSTPENRVKGKIDLTGSINRDKASQPFNSSASSSLSSSSLTSPLSSTSSSPSSSPSLVSRGLSLRNILGSPKDEHSNPLPLSDTKTLGEIMRSSPSSSPSTSRSHSRTPSRSRLPLSLAFLESLSAAPPLVSPTPVLLADDMNNTHEFSTPTPPSRGSLGGNKNRLRTPSKSIIEAMTYSVCPCQIDPDHSVNEKKEEVIGMSVTASTPTLSSKSGMKNSSAGNINSTNGDLNQEAPVLKVSPPPPIPLSITHVLNSIDASARSTSPALSGSNNPNSTNNISPTDSSSISPTTIPHIIDYLESLCHHLQRIKSQLQTCILYYRLQSSNCLTGWLERLEKKNEELIAGLKVAIKQESEVRQRIDSYTAAIEKTNKPHPLSFLRSQSANSNNLLVSKTKLELDLAKGQLDSLGGQRVTCHQQSFNLSTIAAEIKTEDMKRDMNTLTSATQSEWFLTSFGKEEQKLWLNRLDKMKEWRNQMQLCQQHLINVGLTEQECRNRLDELVVMVWR